MKRLILPIFLISGLYACRGYGPGPYWEYKSQNQGYYKNFNAQSYIPYLKTYFNHYKPSLQIDEKNLQIKWIIKANPNDLTILKNHIEFMKKRILEGFTPRKWDRLFVDYAKLRKYIHENITQTNNSLIILQKADNKCAFDFAKAHALAVKNDFFNGNTFKNYSNIAITLENKPECKGYFNE